MNNASPLRPQAGVQQSFGSSQQGADFHPGFPPSPGRKRETLVLEDGLPSILHPKRSHPTLATSYRESLHKRLEIKNKIVLFICEFVGTVLFLFFSFGIATQASNKIDFDTAADPNGPPDTSALLFSSLGFGFSLAVNAWVWFRVTGSLFNPALTLGLTLLGNLSWMDCLTLTLSQFAGGIAAAGLTQGLFPGPINARVSLHGGTTVNQGFWIEFFCTCMLLFTVYMLAGEKHKGTFLAPIGIGLALFLAELLATKYTGGSLNPARSLGPDVASGTFDNFAWIYYIAPYTATLFTTAFYKTLVWLKYGTIVPDMDAGDGHGQKQVIRDVYGNAIGSIETMPEDEFKFADVPEVTIDQRPTAEGDETLSTPSHWKDQQTSSTGVTADQPYQQGQGNNNRRAPQSSYTKNKPSRTSSSGGTDDTFVGGATRARAI
ncbi:aquaporin-like protein [Jaminaea rosea]|uniref:Aquaporin-like protein n=1 Tax=Jaminaea rosea TaxID=1569628 RepID=A0A316UXI9_9BASI|nr:aquaporin-like protein [Jaminaea rosea]PWN30037.1 aquaporin-like protein [Jaminaea rosea]